MILKRSVFVCAVIAAAAVSGLGASSAGAVAIGSDLNRTPNVTYGCNVTPGTGPFGQRLLLNNGVPTCTYMATTASPAESPQALKPGGILTRVSVRTGPTTGPMQATILRATRSLLGFQCCYYAGESQVFTPAPNSVTNVPVRLPMRNDFDTPNAVETVDYLGLSVLAPNVPVPMLDLGGGSVPGAIAFFPRVGPGDVRVDGAGLGGLVPLVAGDFSPTCGATATSALPRDARIAASGCLPGVAIARNRARIRSNRARMTLRCNVATICTGVLRLQSKRRRGKTLASSRIKLAGGGTASLKPRLSRAGKKLMMRKRKRKVWLNTTLTDGSQRVTLSSRVTLSR